MRNKDRVIRELEGTIEYHKNFLKKARRIDDEEVFGKMLEATAHADHYLSEWISSAHRELGGQTPLAMLENPEQRKELLRFLNEMITDWWR
jgi:hypothetical protein